MINLSRYLQAPLWLLFVVVLACSACNSQEQPPARASAATSSPAKLSSYQTALQQYRSSDFSAALSSMNSAIQSDAGSATAYDLRGMIQQQLGDHEAAIVDFNRAIELEPRNASSYNNRALSLQVKGQYVEAETDLVHALDLNPNFALANYNLGVLLYVQGVYTRSLQYLLTASQLSDRKSVV